MNLHISEAYEHESMLPRQGEESCPPGGCTKTSTQCVDVAAQVVLTPKADIGTPVVTCQGNPMVKCVTDPGGTSCTITFTQRVCTSVTIRYGVAASSSTPAIVCAPTPAVGSPCGCGTL